MKNEFVFHLEQDDDMLVATCHEPEMATQGKNLDELLAMIGDLIECRFDKSDQGLAGPILLHFLHDPGLAAQILRQVPQFFAPLLSQNPTGFSLTLHRAPLTSEP